LLVLILLTACLREGEKLIHFLLEYC